MFLVKSYHIRAKRHYSIIDGDENHLVFGVKRDVTTEHEVKFQQSYMMKYQKVT